MLGQILRHNLNLWEEARETEIHGGWAATVALGVCRSVLGIIYR